MKAARWLLTVGLICSFGLSSTIDSRAAAGIGGAPGGPPGSVGVPVGPFVLMACPALIVIAAFLHHRHRELTAAEAWSCGLLALFPYSVAPPPLRVKG